MWMRYYRHYSNGFLMLAGGIQEQPLRYLDAMEIIDIEKQRIRDEDKDR